MDKSIWGPQIFKNHIKAQFPVKTFPQIWPVGESPSPQFVQSLNWLIASWLSANYPESAKYYFPPPQVLSSMPQTYFSVATTPWFHFRNDDANNAGVDSSCQRIEPRTWCNIIVPAFWISTKQNRLHVRSHSKSFTYLHFVKGWMDNGLRRLIWASHLADTTCINWC